MNIAPAAPDRDAATRLARLREPSVRDLAWLLFSADLLRAQLPAGPLAELWESSEEAAATVDWLFELDRNPAALHAALAETSLTRLGRYAEVLLAWFLAQGPVARLVAANVALRRAGRTLGECDFLVETSRGRRLHWELAVKCYLYAGGERGSLADFVGPNLKDRFDWKLAHLLDHQLRLSAREEFAILGHAGPWHAQMLVKGWLFYRVGPQTDAVPREPAELAPDHPRGWWVTHGDWLDFAGTQAVDGWSVLPRLDWLAPRRIGGPGAAQQPALVAADLGEEAGASPRGAQRAARQLAGIDPPVDSRMLLASLARLSEPVMVAAFAAERQAHDGGYVEVSRGFIVPDDWPTRAEAFARE